MLGAAAELWAPSIEVGLLLFTKSLKSLDNP